MPTYDYRCNDCGTHYDVFHKTKEIIEDIVCPSCHSTQHRKLFSVVSIETSPRSDTSHSCAAEERGGECCGGMCNAN